MLFTVISIFWYWISLIMIIDILKQWMYILHSASYWHVPYGEILLIVIIAVYIVIVIDWRHFLLFYS